MNVLIERQAALEGKIELLEARLHAAYRPQRPVPPSSAEPAHLIPKNLATVRLGPRPSKAPPVPTSIALKEPEEEYVREAFAEGEIASDDGRVFDSAMEAIRTGEVEGGAARLISFADKHPRDERAATALFTAGVGLFTSGDASGAAPVLERVSDDYPGAAEAPEATVRLAQCKVRMKNVEAARATYAKVIGRYPKSLAAKTAESELKSIAGEGGTRVP
jgi:TolA-binding protein